MSKYKPKIGDLVELDSVGYNYYSLPLHSDMGIVTEVYKTHESATVFWQKASKYHHWIPFTYLRKVEND